MASARHGVGATTASTAKGYKRKRSSLVAWTASKCKAPAKHEPTKTLCDPIHMKCEPNLREEVEQVLSQTLASQRQWATVQGCRVSERRKNNIIFRLRCGSCHHNRCSWQGFATHSEKAKALLTSELPRKHHGQPKGRAKTGRKSQAGGTKFVEREKLKYHGEWSQDGLHDFVTHHFEDLPISKSLRALCKPRKQTRKGLTCVFFCGTHCSCAAKSDCPWGGRAIFYPLHG